MFSGWKPDLGLRDPVARGVEHQLPDRVEIELAHDAGPVRVGRPHAEAKLALLKNAAQRMGGRVGVQSQVGKGSRFWVDLRAA